MSDLVVREAAVLELVLVSSHQASDPEEALARDYILVDWGTLFRGQHDRHFPHRPVAAARSNSARVAHGLLRTCGGSAYLPRPLVEADLASGLLHLIPHAPVFEMRVYAVHVARGEQRAWVERMLTLL